MHQKYTTHKPMLGLHRNPEGLKWLTNDQKLARLVATRELVGKAVCSSHITHQKVISHSWMNSRNNSGLLATVGLVYFTCEWPNA